MSSLCCTVSSTPPEVGSKRRKKNYPGKLRVPAEKRCCRCVAMWRKARKRGKIIVWKTNMAENIVYRWIYCFVRDEIDTDSVASLCFRLFPVLSCGRGRKKWGVKRLFFCCCGELSSCSRWSFRSKDIVSTEMWLVFRVEKSSNELRNWNFELFFFSSEILHWLATLKITSFERWKKFSYTLATISRPRPTMPNLVRNPRFRFDTCGNVCWEMDTQLFNLHFKQSQPGRTCSRYGWFPAEQKRGFFSASISFVLNSIKVYLINWIFNPVEN